MQRIWEIILGLDPGFLSKEGEFSLQFNPQWPGQHFVGAGVWNFVLGLLALLLVIQVYRKEGRSRGAKIFLGAVRLLLLAFVLALLNRPVLTLGQSRTEPSVLAILIDDSISMRVRDAGSADNLTSRLEAATKLLASDDQAFVRDLRKQHLVRLYRFSRDAAPLESVDQLQPDGQNTQVIQSVRSVLEDLQGQRLAGVIVLTDGRETPNRPLAEALSAIKNYGVKVFPVAVGSDRAPANIEVQSVSVQDAAFKGDIVNVKVSVRGSGYGKEHPVALILKDKKTGRTIPRPDGSDGEQRAALPGDDSPIEIELQFKPEEVGTMDLIVEAIKQVGELDEEDNVRTVQLSVLDAKLAVLYADGYPRWEYRYLKNEMIRDKTVDISCLLTSADPTFAQEGDRPITRFPESIEEILAYDVVIFGDVDPRQFTDSQLQLVADFVSKKGGGFGMIAGPRWSPQAFRNTAIEPILPVNLARVEGLDETGSITQGFRLILSKEGSASSIFRFFADKQVNEKYLREDIPPIFWYCQGITAKPVGEVYAEHPSEIGPDGRKSPILVLGRFGAGRTLFSAIDDSWRWRFYTGESIFDTYWVQQLRYLARSKKLGQRRLTLTSLRPAYELGEQVRISLRILDPQLLGQLPDQLRVEIQDESGQVVRHENLLRQEGQNDLFIGSFTADRVGRFIAKLPAIAGGVDAMDLPLEVRVPRLELTEPRVDRVLLSRLASETLGQTVEFAEARQKLPMLITSAAKVIPIETSQPLWDAPLALALFVLLITCEWVVRKMYGML